MLKSCSYCGRIHDSKVTCDKKLQLQRRTTDIDKFRSSKEWQHKREEIKERDLYLCQVCIRELYDTVNKYNYANLSVHHATPLEVDFDKRLDNDILLTMCSCHHEKAESGEIPLNVILKIIIEQEKGDHL